MTTYRDVMRKPEMPAVLIAHGVSLLGSVAAEVALSVLVFRRTGSPLLSALTLACGFLPQALSAMVLSGIVDRVPPRRLLVTVDLTCAALVACMAIDGTPTYALLLLAGALGIITPLFSGARAATLADLLEGEAWVLARSMMRILSQSALLLGYALGGLFLALIGPRSLLVVDAVSFVASATLLRLGTTARPARAQGKARPSFGVLGTVMRDPAIRPVLLMTWLPGACVCSIDALATPYARNPAGIGAILAAAAGGSVVSEVLGRKVRDGWVRPVALLTALGLLLFVLHPPVWGAVLLTLLMMQGGAIGQRLDARLLAVMSPELRGQLLSIQNGLFMAIQGAGIALAGAFAEVFPPYAVLAGAGVIALATVATQLPAQESRRIRNAVPSLPS